MDPPGRSATDLPRRGTDQLVYQAKPKILPTVVATRQPILPPRRALPVTTRVATGSKRKRKCIRTMVAFTFVTVLVFSQLRTAAKLSHVYSSLAALGFDIHQVSTTTKGAFSFWESSLASLLFNSGNLLPGSKLSLVAYPPGQQSAGHFNATTRDREDTMHSHSFLVPESYTTRYPQLENRTAAESVAAEYKQTALQTKSSEYDPLASCSVTSQVRVVQNNPLWILESIDAKGNPKTVGGDEFYVTYRDDIVAKATEVTAAAFIDDLGDGTYSLDFVTTPMNPIPSNLTGRGTLTVNFQYSCGIGKAHQPVKDKCTMGGATFIRHSAAMSHSL